MQTVDEKPETIHLYVVREEKPKPSLFPILLSGLTLSLLLVCCILAPYRQPVQEVVILVPAVFLPIRNFGISVAIIPTGRKVYEATTAQGVLALYNGSIITQQIPQGMILTSTQGVEVVVEDTVVVPAGNAPNFGIAWVTTHALISGKRGNIPAFSINTVINSSLSIRNPQRFTGGRDAYSVKIVTSQDRQTALKKARAVLTNRTTDGLLASPCKEKVTGDMTVSWTCQFYTYSVSPIVQVIQVRLSGETTIVDGFIVERPKPFNGK